MKKVIWRNKDLAEPICIDAEGNALEEYDPSADCPDCEVLVLENGYGYLILDGEVQDGYCLQGQNFWKNYVDADHPAIDY